jgi:hypothetical protein
MIFKILLPKMFSEKFGIFDSKYCVFMQKKDQNIGFQEKRQFISPKIGINRSKL